MNATETEVQDKVAEFYEELRYKNPYAKRYHECWTSKMVSLIRQDGLILDNGCGTGMLAESLTKAKVIGLDISKGMLNKAKKRLSNLVLADSQDLPFKDNIFDTVFCRSILHHLPNPKLGVSEIHRVLKVGGEAIFSETNSSFLNNIPRKIIKKTEHFSEGHKNFDRKELLALIGSKLRVEDVQFFGYIAYPLIGFPDLIDVFRYLPLKTLVEKILIGIDELIALIPGLNKQSWGIIVKAKKEAC
ncbi:class I SAM-dependent methyltransferase [Candidatus Margulisiibacteriota bacterium]